jgi:hypothetical protein
LYIPQCLSSALPVLEIFFFFSFSFRPHHHRLLRRQKKNSIRFHFVCLVTLCSAHSASSGNSRRRPWWRCMMYTLLPPSLFRRLCSVIFSGTRWITTAIVTGTASIVLQMKNSRLVSAAEETRKEKKKTRRQRVRPCGGSSSIHDRP